ncbi:hypothetical protein K488DRAFT_89004 [Vararia minispora EC-137]|uniref:Uncharacterized protein n=1 Tax=Vararia minispora EC-137 TaxID=1314806 RepID=A0ACB8QD09_9AGAM|nr:hypothetical protein K488DRAFT_89004 [Vararia minispora EC-137]
MANDPRPSAPVPQDAAPRTIKLTIRALLSFPFRLCNPPPAVGKVRSCQMTPVFKVQLEDVLNRKHLPPLGLKDFEEWLLFVEGNPENLYFILWLKEYAARYNHWASQARPPKPRDRFSSDEHYRFSTQALPSNQLAHFYLRAKQTFFTPGGEFELNIPSDILSPFHTGHFVSPHPDPIVFSEVAYEVHKMLKESLDRFVVAQYSNVGSSRALCGIIGGTVIALLGSVAPMAVNFTNGRSRWLRLLALPGLWLGLTVIICSLYGVCMMVYVFGDLRQLHKFELSRPQISSPRPLGFNERAHSDPSSAAVAYKGADSSASILPPYAFVRPRPAPPPSPRPVLTPITIPEAARVHEARRGASPSSSVETPYDRSSRGSSCSSLSIATDDADLNEITMSPAYYEDPAPEGPNTRTGPWSPLQSQFPPQSVKSDWIPSDHTPECNIHRIHGTAGFIHAFEEEPHDVEAGVLAADDATFDFDALPLLADGAPCICGGAAQPVPAIASSIALPAEEADEPDIAGEKAAPLPRYRAEPPRAVASDLHPAPRPYCQRGRPDVVVGRHVAWMRAVPAFGPLTRVLSPVVSRAQWEIVIKSGLIAAVASIALIAGLTAVPVVR